MLNLAEISSIMMKIVKLNTIIRLIQHQVQSNVLLNVIMSIMMKTIYVVLIVMGCIILIINVLVHVILQQNHYFMKIAVVMFVLLNVKILVCLKNHNIRTNVYHYVLM